MRKINLSIHHKWLSFFSLWILFLSGILTPFLGSPGILQALQLKTYFHKKNEQLRKFQMELSQLQKDSTELLQNPHIQEKEIRTTLGYTGKNDLIFDFSSMEAQTQ